MALAKRRAKTKGDVIAGIRGKAAAAVSVDLSVISSARLKLVGSCRNADDEARLEALKKYAVEVGVGDSVDW